MGQNTRHKPKSRDKSQLTNFAFGTHKSHKAILHLLFGKSWN